MSANNYLFIKKIGRNYIISERVFDAVYNHEITRKTSLKAAVEFAKQLYPLIVEVTLQQVGKWLRENELMVDDNDVLLLENGLKPWEE